MQEYLYELHCHTSVGSRCAVITPEELVRFYHAQGYTGIVLTEHFLNGNTTVPRDLSWEDRIELYYKSYEAAKAEGDKLGLDVFAAYEYSYLGTDFLTYGIDKEWLLAHPDILEPSVPEYCKIVRENGGFVAQAHPYREADYIQMIRLLPRDVDAVEVINANRTDFENEMADKYADAYNLIKITGSDNHSGHQPRISAMCFDHRLESQQDMINQIKTGNYSIKVINLEK